MKKIVLVTGGSRGLGRNMALSLAKKWHDVIITYKSNSIESTRVVEEISALGSNWVALQLDARDVASLERFVETLKSTLSSQFNTEHIDYLVNNAGMWMHALISETTEDQFDQLMSVHFKGVFFLTQKLLWTINDNGWIINISSGLARFSMPWYAAYASMKWAIETLTKYLAKELWSRWIRANVVAPGAIETDFWGGAVRDNKDLNSFVSSITALGRAWLPDDIGGVVAFLCSEDSKWITWQRIEVSGWMNL